MSRDKLHSSKMLIIFSFCKMFSKVNRNLIETGIWTSPRQYTNATECSALTPVVLFSFGGLLDCNLRRGGLESSSNSWLRHLGAKCLGLLISIVLHPDPKQHWFLPSFQSLDNTQSDAERRRLTRRLSGTVVLRQSRSQVAMQMSPVEMWFHFSANIVSSSDSSSSNLKKSLYDSVTTTIIILGWTTVSSLFNCLVRVI